MKKIDLNSPSSSIRTASVAQLGSKVVNVLVQLAITMVLARLLSPAEYGTVAVLTVFSTLFAILADAGVSTAIAQSQDLTEADYSRLFFLSFFIGLVLAIAFFALSFGIAWFYEDSIYVPLGGLMTLAVLFNALNMVPNGILIKQRKFKLIGIRLVVCSAVVGAVSILLASLGFGCYAIVLNTVLTSLFVFVWNLIGSRLRMSVGSVRAVVVKIGAFSAYNLGSNAIYWFASNVDSLLVGKLFGSSALGYYNKAYNLYGYPLTILMAPITSTILPFLAPLQNDVEALRSRFLGVFRKVSFISALCTACMNVCSAEIILIMYGDNWIPSIQLLATLAFAVYSRGVNSAFTALLNATGHPRLLMRSTAINTVITLTLIFAGGVLGSVESLAICIAIAYNLEMILPIYFCARYSLQMSAWHFFAHFLPDLIAALLAMFVALLIPWGIENIFLSLIVKGCLVVVIMLTIKLPVNRIVYHEGLVSSLKGLLRR